MMVVMWLAWLAVPFLALAALVSAGRLAARWHTHREIDQAYERLCLETGHDIF